MQVEYLFSKNDKIGSKLICWVSSLLIDDMDEIPSHAAVLLDGWIVMESTLFNGVRSVPYSYWKTINQECYRIPHKKAKTKEEVYKTFVSVFSKGYDYLGVLYFAKCFFMHKFFKVDFPKINKWQRNDRYFCNEFAGRLIGYNKYSMTTPAKMCKDLLNHDRNG